MCGGVPFLSLAVPDLAAVAALGRALWQEMMPGTVVALRGTLGAGKTALARAVIRAMPGAAEEDVPSPTFTLVQTYDMPAGGTLWHFDLYRLTTPEDALELGMEEAFAEGVSLIEWPERLGPWLPFDRIDITLIPTGPQEMRQAEVRGHGRWIAHLDSIARAMVAEKIAVNKKDDQQA
ncbi:MAG: hypothetical protein FD149_1164 [Rhodospirillaceae bacterium]|nr:MAG: hypothetical protein FD149_1164 [Rhodospirillaceae bacterium]